MDDKDIFHTIDLMSRLSLSDINEALAIAFRSPAPPFSGRVFLNAYTQWRSPDVQLQRVLLMLKPSPDGRPPTIKQFQHHYTYSDGIQAGFEVEYVFPQKIDSPALPNVDRKTLWKQVGHQTKAVLKAEAFLEAVRREEAADKMDILLKTAEKCGIPKTKADLLAKTGKIEDILKPALTRYAIKMAVANGACSQAAMTALFDIRELFDGHVKQYLAKVGVNGLYGGTVGGLSSWINHPVYGNGIVLGVVVGTAFGTVNLASTGDWARFGKSLGLNVLGGASAWGGSAAGSAIGAVGGPIGVAIGSIAGGVIASLLGRHIASQVPGLKGVTDREVKAMYKVIIEQLSSAGLEPDGSLSPRQVVEATMGAGGGGPKMFNFRMTDSMAAGVESLEQVLRDLRTTSPEEFAMFRVMLRAACSETLPI